MDESHPSHNGEIPNGGISNIQIPNAALANLEVIIHDFFSLLMVRRYTVWFLKFWERSKQLELEHIIGIEKPTETMKP